MKRPIWESEWHGINFRDIGTSTSIYSRAGTEFYDELYSVLFQRYDSFELMPSEWRSQKLSVADEIRKLHVKNSSILSIGCGIGFIEKALCNDKNISSIDVFDSSQIAVSWLKSEEKITILTDLEGQSRYDFLFCVQLGYSMTDRELQSFAKVVRAKMKADGCFLTVDTSPIPAENGVHRRPEIVGKTFMRLARNAATRERKYQFWGWLRDNERVAKIFASCGFRLENGFSAVGQSFQLFRAR